MNPLKRIYQILYPFIIWIGTLLIPLGIAAIVILISTKRNESDGDFEMLKWFGLIGFAVSIPAVLLFAIVYYICLLTKRSNKFTKWALHVTNLINIFGTIFLVVGGLYLDKSDTPILLGGALVLLIPSVPLIVFLKIPRRKIV